MNCFNCNCQLEQPEQSLEGTHYSLTHLISNQARYILGHFHFIFIKVLAMIPGEPKQAPKDPELDLMKIDLCYVIGYRPRRWSMKVLFKGIFATVFCKSSSCLCLPLKCQGLYPNNSSSIDSKRLWLNSLEWQWLAGGGDRHTSVGHKCVVLGANNYRYSIIPTKGYITKNWFLVVC